MKKLLARFASWLTGKTAPTHELLQVHLIGTVCGKDFFQVAQRRFAVRATPGERLEWISQMVGKCSIVRPAVEVYREGDECFIRIAGIEGDDTDPVYLTTYDCGHVANGARR